jgi:hypothetical protein
MDTIDGLIARSRERKRRDHLQWEIERLERKLDKIGPNPIGQLTRNRAYRLIGEVKRLKGQLAQPELLL